MILDESMTFNSVLHAISLIAMRRNNNIVRQVEGIILRDGNIMEWAHIAWNGCTIGIPSEAG